MRNAVVVGAGLGGLSAAIHLATAGWRVRVIEKNARPGGKAAERAADTPLGRFRWDTGPSLITMPHVLRALFDAAGERMEDHLELQRVEPACRYAWTGGARIDEDAGFWKRPDVTAYLRHARGIHELSGEAYLTRAPCDWWRAFGPSKLPTLRHLPKVATFQSLAALNRRFFRDPRLIQIFDRFATYNGSSPWKTPATFAIIPFVEAEFGAWFPKGGIARIPEELHRLALRCGVAFELGREITDLAAVRADAVVCNGDAITASARWLREPARAARLQRPEMSCSGLVLLLGVRGAFPGLSHHNIFFSGEYPGEFRAIFDEQRLPPEPTIYLAATSRANPEDAPPGCENWFLLVNAPPNPAVRLDGYEEIVLERLARFGVAPGPGAIVHREIFGPADIARRDNAWRGSLYGWASHSLRTALFRPSLRHPRIRNLYFVGGATHPGGGIPLVLLGGRIVAGRILRDLGKTPS